MGVLDELLYDHTDSRRTLQPLHLHVLLQQVVKATNFAKQGGESDFVLQWGDRVLSVVELMQAASCADALHHEQIRAMVSSMQAEAILHQGNPKESLKKARQGFELSPGVSSFGCVFRCVVGLPTSEIYVEAKRAILDLVCSTQAQAQRNS